MSSSQPSPDHKLYHSLPQAVWAKEHSYGYSITTPDGQDIWLSKKLFEKLFYLPNESPT